MIPSSPLIVAFEKFCSNPYLFMIFRIAVVITTKTKHPMREYEVETER